MESAPAKPRNRRAIAGAAALILSLVGAAPAAFAQSKAPAAPPPAAAPAPPPSTAAPPPAAAAPPQGPGAPAAPPPAGQQPMPTGNQLVPPNPYPMYPYPPPYTYPYPPYGYGYPRPRFEPLPDTIDYEEGMAIPPGYQLTRKPRKGLVIAGVVTLATGYGLAALVGGNGLVLGGESEIGLLFVPVAGPFLTIAALDYGDAFTTGLLLLDGVTQVGGLAFLIAGFVAKEEVLERRDKVQSRPAPEFFVGPRSVGMRLKF